MKQPPEQNSEAAINNSETVKTVILTIRNIQ